MGKNYDYLILELATYKALQTKYATIIEWKPSCIDIEWCKCVLEHVNAEIDAIMNVLEKHINGN